MKTRGLLAIFLLVILASSTIAVSSTSTSSSTSSNLKSSTDKAYQCLQSEIDNKTSFSLQEVIFSALALGSSAKSAVTSRINQDKSSDNCWPNGKCTIKDTAQALLAYDRLGKDTKAIQNWLTSKAAQSTDIQWLLEIDIDKHIPAECTISHDTTKFKINIQDDLTLSGSSDSCLSISNDGYYLAIKDSCLDKEFDVTCSEDFLTTLIYQKKSASSDSPVYITSQTTLSSGGGSTSEQVDAKCFKLGTNCDYEGSLWATLALQKSSLDISSYTSYLLALASDNSKYFPSAFLYLLTSRSDQNSEVINRMSQDKYWDISSYGKFYDTSLGLLSLGSASPAPKEVSYAQNYLIDLQLKSGCWNSDSIKDTAFILYALSPKSGGTSVGASTLCTEVAGYSCVKAGQCDDTTSLSGFECPSFGQICCATPAKEKTCSEKNGEICASDKQCSSDVIHSSDTGDCCLGSCKDRLVSQDTCKLDNDNGVCKTSCGSNEIESATGSCGNSELCCVPNEKSGGISFFMWLLIILILLVIMAIIFRNKIRIWYYSHRGNARSSPIASQRRPPFPPAGTSQARPMPSYQMQRPIVRQPIRRPSTSDKEFDETLKKLRDMSK